VSGAEPAQVVGVVGAGTMGAGIAQLAASYGAHTLLHDPLPEALQDGLAKARGGLERWREKGKLSGEPGPLDAAGALADLAGCDLIIEAAPERLELKQDLFKQLSAIAPNAVLATNTSSIPVSAIAPAAADPSRVVGMHFFNPPPLMKLVEVVAGLDSGDDALALTRATGEAMGKRVIDAADVTGFLVNRCARPFGLEALRTVETRQADVETVDMLLRAAGFRMGPFELQDLVGIDVGFAVSTSFYEQSFGEPRWRPSPLSARMVSGGRHGRKTGRGWYAYDGDTPHRPEDPPAPEPGGGDGRLVVIAGDLAIAHELRARADEHGWEVVEEAGGEVPFLCIDAGHPFGDEEPLQGAPQLLLCADGSLHQLDPSGTAAGFHALAPLDPGMPVELTRGLYTTQVALERAVEFFAALGLRTFGVKDGPGLVLGRIVCQLINECVFALQDGVTDDPAAIDDGLVFGLNHPRGALSWADQIGLDHVLMVLDALRTETGEERYRAAPLLRRMVAEGLHGELVGHGFHIYQVGDHEDHGVSDRDDASHDH
jgi:3-hydroxybutyryl-CoA dehydrogenase